MYLTKKFTFSAAHKLPNYQGKCKNLHGHTYLLEITIEGKINPRNGMIIDFYDLEKIVQKKIIEKLDHSYLNDKFKIPTTENIGLWIWQNLEKSFKRYKINLYEIKLWESDKSFITLRRENE